MIYKITMIFWLIKGNYYGAFYEGEKANGYKALANVAEGNLIQSVTESDHVFLWVFILTIMTAVLVSYYVIKETVKLIIK